MKSATYILSCTLLLLSLTSCLEEKCQTRLEYKAYEPVLLSGDEFRTTVRAEEGRELCRPAGFYVYGDYLMIIEDGAGLHIFDNADPTAPRSISFLPVDGAAGLAVRNDILYVNQFVDLLAFDLRDPESPTMVGRTEDVFEPYSIFTDDLGYERMVVGYEETDAVRYLDCEDPLAGNQFFWEDGLVFFAGSADDFAVNRNLGSENGGGGEQVGVGGSLARFTITNSTLYAVDESRLKTFNLADPQQPEFMGNVQLSWNVETIFPNGDELYIGTNSGMHIFDVSNSLEPVRLSSLEHVRSCDPVVVSGDKAYLTLRGGNRCGGFENQLEIIDVSNPSFPDRLQIYPMNHPAGLSVGDGKLFLCEPGFSFKVYDLDDDGMLGELLTSEPDMAAAMDVIGLPWLDRLITIGDDGVDQLSYDEEGLLSPLSHLDVCAEL